MAKKIQSSDIFEGDLLEVLIKEIVKAETKLDGLSKKLVGIGSTLKNELKDFSISDLDSITKLLQKTKEVENSMKEQLKLEKEKQSLEAKRIVLEEKLDAIKKKNQQDELLRLEKIKGIQDKNYEQAYRDLLKNEAEIKRLDELKKKASSDELIRIEKERQAREKSVAEQKINISKIQEAQAKADILSQKLKTDASKESDRQRKEAQREADRLQREAEKQQKKLERERKIAEDLANAYKQLEKNTRELKNESKKLGAELLDLERNGQRNTKAYRDLEKQYKETTKQALEGDKALKKLDQQVGDNFRSVGHYEKATRFLKNALAEMGLAFGAFEGVRYLIDSQVRLDSLSLSLKNVSKGSKDYGENVAFLRRISKDYGQDLLNLTETYKNFIASTDNSSLSLTERRRIYESIIKAGSSLALSNDDVAGTLRAVQQMFSKGTVQAEELRQQLGDRLPGAFQLMAKSMGVTEEVLGDMMKKGLVLADDVMPRFATELEKSMGNNARARVNTLGGAWNNLKNEVLLYFNEAQSGYDINRSLADALNYVANNLKSIIGLIVTAIKVWAGYKLVVTSSQLANKLLGNSFLDLARDGKIMSSMVDGVKTAFGGLANFFKTNVVGMFVLFGTEMVATYTKLKSISNKLREYRSELKQSRDDLINQSKNEKTYLESMIDTLKKTNYESNRRKEILDELNSKYGTNIQNIKDEKTFLLELNDAYKEINKTLDLKLKGDIARINVETSQKQVAEARANMDLAMEALRDKERQLGIPQLNYERLLKGDVSLWKELAVVMKSTVDAVIGKFGGTDLLELTDEWNRYSDVWVQLNRQSQKYQEEYKKVLKLINSGSGNIGRIGDGKQPKDVPSSYQPQVELNTQLVKTEIYLSRQVELLKDIQTIMQEIANIDVLDKQEKILEAQRKSAEEKGKYDKEAVKKAIQAQRDALLEANQKDLDAKKDDPILKAQQKTDEEREKLTESRNKRQLEIDKKYEKYKDKLEVNKANGEKNLTATATLRYKEKKKALSKDEKEFYEAQIELEKNFQEEMAIVQENYKKRIEDAYTEKEKLELEHQKKKAEIIKDANNKTNKEVEDNDKKVAEYKLEQIKKMANAVNDLTQLAIDAYVKTIERKISMLEDRMNRMAQNSQYLQDKAVAGNITAQESLAKAQEDQLNTEKEKIKYQKSIQRLQMALAIFNAYNNNIQNAKVGENAFAKTITDVSALSAFVSALPTFYEGTETTVSEALGKPQLSGKDGHIIRVDGSEKILNPYLSQKTGDLTTFEIAKIAEDRLKGKLMYNSESNSTANNMWASIKLIDEIQDLKDIIKNKPETNIAMGEIVGGVMKIVESTKVNNTTTRNIHRFNKKI
jgi:tape measure domain-containing protein